LSLLGIFSHTFTFLFAGKTISVNDPHMFDCKVAQSFDYDQVFWVKTLLSLIALPVAEPLGASFKGLAYFSSEVRERHNKIQKHSMPLI